MLEVSGPAVAPRLRGYPHIGGVERHEETIEEWLALQRRLDAVFARLGLRSTPMDLVAEPSARSGK